MKIRKEVPQQAPDRAPVTFHDVAAYFSEEEWTLLHQWQKELYKNVMKEIHQALFSLGHQIVNPNILLRISKKEKPGFRDPEKRTDTDPAAACPPAIQPDVLFRIRQEEKLYCRNWYWSEETETGHNLLKEDAFANSDVLQRRKREGNVCIKDRRNAGRKGIGDCSTAGQKDVIGGFTVPSTANLRKQDESNANLMDTDGAKGREVTTSPISGVPLIIKEEGDTYLGDHQDCKRKEGHSDPTGGPVVTAVMSRSLKSEAEARLQEDLKPEPRTTADGRMSRKRMAGYSVTCAETTSLPRRAPSGNAKVMPICRSENGTHLTRQRWPKTTPEMAGEETNQCESDFRNQAPSGLRPETPKVGTVGQHNDSGNNLMKAQLLKCQSSAQQNWGPYPFTECGKTFRENIGFIKCQRTHTGERSYQCAECDKSFSQKVNLIRHQRTHTGERPYHCTQCEKKFSHKHHLKGHQRTHTGERPYQCTRCTKSFSWKESLSRHQRTHSGERPYQCTECEQSFSLKEGLIRHQRTHMREMCTVPASAARLEVPQSTTYVRNPRGLDAVKWTIAGDKEPVFCC